jgi:hypothetical protein
MQRIGNDERWATLYDNGWWTVYDRTDGVIAHSVTRTEAEELLPCTDPVTPVVKAGDLVALLSKDGKRVGEITPPTGQNWVLEIPKDVHSDEWFAYCFENRGRPVPQDIRTAATRLVRAYGIRGICDPLYIANVIARETGRGDGEGNFVEAAS